MITSQTPGARFPPRCPRANPGVHGRVRRLYHLARMEGTVEESTLHYLIRDFDDDRFAACKAQLKERVASLQLDCPKARITLEIEDNYRNMRSQIAPYPHIVELAKAAMEAADVVRWKIKPIAAAPTAPASPLWDCPAPTCSPGPQLPRQARVHPAAIHGEGGRHPGGAGAPDTSWVGPGGQITGIEDGV